MMFKHSKHLSTLFFAATLALPTISVHADQCNSNIQPPTVIESTSGADITCPTSSVDPNRDYGALVLLRGEEQIPLVEGSTYDPFNGTWVEFLTPDWEPNDKFFMRAVCEQNQFDSSLRPENIRSQTPLPEAVKEARRRLKEAYKKKAIPEPKFVGIEGTGPNNQRTIRIAVPKWTQPTVETPDVTVEVRAALIRKSLGQVGDPDIAPPLPHDGTDRTLRIPWPSGGSGSEMTFLKIRVRQPDGGTLLKGAFPDVFDESTTDSVLAGNHYSYRIALFFTMIHEGIRYNTQARGEPMKLQVKQDRVIVH